MTRAPFVMGKSQEAFGRQAEIHDTTIGWRFVNKAMKERYGTDSMPETGENVAQDFQVSRADQDAFALRSQQRAAKAQADGFFAGEIVPVDTPGGRGGPVIVDRDEHPRADTTSETLAKLKPIVRADGTVTAGNASGVNDGAAALILASTEAVRRHGLHARARVLGMASAGVDPRIMGIGPAPAIRKLMERAEFKLSDIDLFEVNEAFAAPTLLYQRELSLGGERFNVNGGAIALGHAMGATGTTLVGMLADELDRRGLKRGVAAVSGALGLGAAVIIETLP
jgi:3-oxoadipyl-CoA thiolase